MNVTVTHHNAALRLLDSQDDVIQTVPINITNITFIDLR